MRFTAGIIVLVALSCGGPWGPVSFVDEGEVCFSQEVSDVRAEVNAPDCLSSGCSRNVETSCSATVEGTRIELTSDIRWEEKGGACNADCGIATATCSLGPLADGTYTVVHGEDEIELVVPVESQSCPL